jgi:hypothetical protein
MSHDTDFLIALAEIAGVFVGFGALISVTDRGPIDPARRGQVRTVVLIGLVVMVAALFPVGLSRYGLADADLWWWSSLAFFALIWTAILLAIQNRQHREEALSQLRKNPVSGVAFWLFLEVPVQVPLVLALLGLYPGLEPAFYATAVVLNLFEAAFVLAQLVFARASGPPVP